MSITLTFGWWLIPAIITLIAFGKWTIYVLQRESGGDYDFGDDLGVNAVIGLLVAAIISSFSWMVYFGMLLCFLRP